MSLVDEINRWFRFIEYQHDHLKLRRIRVILPQVSSISDFHAIRDNQKYDFIYAHVADLDWETISALELNPVHVLANRRADLAYANRYLYELPLSLLRGYVWLDDIIHQQSGAIRPEDEQKYAAFSAFVDRVRARVLVLEREQAERDALAQAANLVRELSTVNQEYDIVDTGYDYGPFASFLEISQPTGVTVCCEQCYHVGARNHFTREDWTPAVVRSMTDEALDVLVGKVLSVEPDANLMYTMRTICSARLTTEFIRTHPNLMQWDYAVLHMTEAQIAEFGIYGKSSYVYPVARPQEFSLATIQRIWWCLSWPHLVFQVEPEVLIWFFRFTSTKSYPDRAAYLAIFNDTHPEFDPEVHCCTGMHAQLAVEARLRYLQHSPDAEVLTAIKPFLEDEELKYEDASLMPQEYVPRHNRESRFITRAFRHTRDRLPHAIEFEDDLRPADLKQEETLDPKGVYHIGRDVCTVDMMLETHLVNHLSEDIAATDDFTDADRAATVEHVKHVELEYPEQQTRKIVLPDMFSLPHFTAIRRLNDGSHRTPLKVPTVSPTFGTRPINNVDIDEIEAALNDTGLDDEMMRAYLADGFEVDEDFMPTAAKVSELGFDNSAIHANHQAFISESGGRRPLATDYKIDELESMSETRSSLPGNQNADDVTESVDLIEHGNDIALYGERRPDVTEDFKTLIAYRLQVADPPIKGAVDAEISGYKEANRKAFGDDIMAPANDKELEMLHSMHHGMLEKVMPLSDNDAYLPPY